MERHRRIPTDDMIQALQGLHISELLGFEDDGADEEGPNDMDAPLRAIQGGAKDYTMGGSANLQATLSALIEYSDIFSYSVKGRSMDVPPIEFSLDTDIWQSNPNRAASRQISTEKQAALSTLIYE